MRLWKILIVYAFISIQVDNCEIFLSKQADGSPPEPPALITEKIEIESDMNYSFVIKCNNKKDLQSVIETLQVLTGVRK